MEGESATNDEAEYQYDFGRDSENIVGRICTLSSLECEQYNLRTLLRHVPEAASSQDMWTFEGNVYKINRETCLNRGFVPDDAEWKRAPRDAFTSLFHPLTDLYAIKLAHCEPEDPKIIFENLKDNFITNLQNSFKLQSQPSDPLLALDYLLKEISTSLSTIS